ncbi:hypothetical protein NQ015_08375 [Corynebacterium sp. 153RC1]|nr:MULTISPECIES: hypothetical protein [unclassified Corynebacterium]MCQ9370829.1 hypothetical protein [Corynebacterium sp. 35RC1]MCQ9353511.1 hypothetical protein [Corynebacterium sp. 209RC1]MCQ9355121.1 hypothetical protein [Corynebacterium sp. 1222RC1]MCQ9357246.1 hypothetical protein [Corynebacterium sp. 122RC1]MCQ9359421.1 hypothetical protein [Corynebacterium sp. 142RC1]
MNQAVFAFCRYEDASLSYVDYASHAEQKRRADLRQVGLYDTAIALQAE